MVKVIIERFGIQPKMTEVRASNSCRALQAAILMHDPFQNR